MTLWSFNPTCADCMLVLKLGTPDHTNHQCDSLCIKVAKILGEDEGWRIIPIILAKHPDIRNSTSRAAVPYVHTVQHRHAVTHRLPVSCWGCSAQCRKSLTEQQLSQTRGVERQPNCHTSQHLAGIPLPPLCCLGPCSKSIDGTQLHAGSCLCSCG